MEAVEIPGYEAHSSLPDWVLGKDPTYPTTETTTTGYLSDSKDFVYYMVDFDKNGIQRPWNNKCITKEEYENAVTSDALNQASYSTYTDSTGNVVEEIRWQKISGTTGVSSIGDFQNTYGSILTSNIKASRSINWDYRNPTDKINMGIIDFSNLNKDNILELVGGDGSEDEKHGFNSTCKTCSQHYSISFVNGTGDRASGGIFDVDLASLIEKANNGQEITGTDLVKRIMEAVDIAGSSSSRITLYDENQQEVQALRMYDHYQTILINPENTNQLLMIDERYRLQGSTYIYYSLDDFKNTKNGQFSFVVYDGQDPQLRYDPVKKPVSLDLLQDGTTPDDKIYTMYYMGEERDFFRIQSGANGGQELTIRLPDISLEKMQIKDLNVLDHGNAAVSIDRCKAAINYINTETQPYGSLSKPYGACSFKQ